MYRLWSNLFCFVTLDTNVANAGSLDAGSIRAVESLMRSMELVKAGQREIMSIMTIILKNTRPPEIDVSHFATEFSLPLRTPSEVRNLESLLADQLIRARWVSFVYNTRHCWLFKKITNISYVHLLLSRCHSFQELVVAWATSCVGLLRELWPWSWRHPTATKAKVQSNKDSKLFFWKES